MSVDIIDKYILPVTPRHLYSLFENCEGYYHVFYPLPFLSIRCLQSDSEDGAFTELKKTGTHESVPVSHKIGLRQINRRSS